MKNWFICTATDEYRCSFVNYHWRLNKLNLKYLDIGVTLLVDREQFKSAKSGILTLVTKINNGKGVELIFK